MKSTTSFTFSKVTALTLIGTLLYGGTPLIEKQVYAHEANMGQPSAGTPNQPATTNQPGMTHQHSSGEGHAHKTMVIPPGQPVPTVNLAVTPDAMSGWNLQLKVTNFAFAPERVNTKGIATEGHAHLYIDGKKVTRLYGPWYYLGNLSPGQHTITVTLNSNGHEDLIYNGKPIQATQVIQVPGK